MPMIKIAKSIPFDLEGYAKGLGIKIVLPGEAAPEPVPLESELCVAIEHRVAWMALRHRKFKPLDIAKNAIADKCHAFLDKNHRNIRYLRAIMGPTIQDDTLNACIKITVAFVGRAVRVSEDGTMISMEAT